MTPAQEQMALVADEVRQVLSYDPVTGVFNWKTPNRRGTVAGHLRESGYIKIIICGRRYSAHRLAWLLMHGYPIPPILDHVDGNKANNAISNLRAATSSQNQFNARFKGFSFSRRDQRWLAKIVINGRAIYLGSFSTAEEARAAYIASHIKLAGDFSPYLRADRSSSGEK